jgi:hypothetical protein
MVFDPDTERLMPGLERVVDQPEGPLQGDPREVVAGNMAGVPKECLVTPHGREEAGLTCHTRESARSSVG